MVSLMHTTVVILFALAGSAMCHSCTPQQFTCSNGKCISKEFLCDGDNDCEDQSDELTPANCPPCDQYEFRCENGRCIPSNWVCNFQNECGDSSDEPVDKSRCPACAPYQFRCNSGQCIHRRWVCNSRRDCADGSDEHSNCTSTATNNNHT